MNMKIMEYNDRAIALIDKADIKKELKYGKLKKCPECNYIRFKVYKHCPNCDYVEIKENGNNEKD